MYFSLHWTKTLKWQTEILVLKNNCYSWYVCLELKIPINISSKYIRPFHSETHIGRILSLYSEFLILALFSLAYFMRKDAYDQAILFFGDHVGALEIKTLKTSKLFLGSVFFQICRDIFLISSTKSINLKYVKIF